MPGFRARCARGALTALVGVLSFSLIAPGAMAGENSGGWAPSNWTGVITGAPVPGVNLPPSKAPAAPVPLPPELDVAPSYEGQQQCDPSPKPGAVRLSDLIKGTYGANQTVWIPRGCDVGGQSEHKEGRALDWMVSVRKAQERADAETFLNWLLGPDQNGVAYGNAMRLGVMYIGWNDRIWRGYEIDRGWTELKGCFSKPDPGADTVCHRNHIHISLTWDGATGTNSFWDGTAQTAGFCPRDTSGAKTPDDTPKGDLIAVSPVRVLDTAAGLGVAQRCRLQQDRFSGDSHRIFVPVLGRGGVPPSGVSGVRVRIEAQQSNAPATVRVWSPGQPKSQPAVQVGMNSTAAAEVVVPVSTEGTIALATSAGATDVAVDVLGYYASGANGPPASTAPAPKPPLEPEPTDFFPLGSVIGYESGPDAPLQPGEERTVTLAGLPPEAKSALVFVTGKDATAKGSLRIGRVDDANAAATFTFPKNRMRKAVMLVPVSGGQVKLATSKKPAVQIRVEVLGYGTSDAPRTPHALTPRSFFAAKVGAGQTQLVDAAGRAGLPGKKKLKAVLLRVQTRKAAADGTVSVFASGAQPPATRMAPVVANTKYAALVLAPIGPDGKVAVSSSVDTKVKAMVVGYVT